MARKVFTFEAHTSLNPEKGGGWMATYILSNDQDSNQSTKAAAWKNSSAAKRWLKAQAAALTPRKGVKLLAGPEKDEKGRPTKFIGSFTFKAPK